MMASWFSAAIAITALGFSIFMAWLTNRNFELSNRPYLTAMSYAWLVEERGVTRLMNDPYRILLKNMKAPAKVISGEVWFNLSQNERIGNRIGNGRPVPHFIVLPLERTEAVLSTAAIEGLIESLEETQGLVRQLYFEYEWCGNDMRNERNRVWRWMTDKLSARRGKYSYHCSWDLDIDVWNEFQDKGSNRPYWKVREQKIT